MKQNKSTDKQIYLLMATDKDEFKLHSKDHVKTDEMQYWTACSVVYASYERDFVINEARWFNHTVKDQVYFVKPTTII